MLGVSGKYRLDQRLGGGGMAEVFLASAIGAEGFSRKVAIKRVLPGFSDNEAFAQMFVDEAQISSQLVHPNIVSVLDFDRDDEHRLFLVMELVEGKDLDALLATGMLPIPLVVYVIAEILRGLGYAHDLPVGAHVRGVVHRDVSPHNVLLSWEGAVKVSDFGIAKARAASEATASVFIKGKPAYMSPEQANGQPLDGRSDLFAAGIMLWEMLVGRRLFIGDDTRATLAAVLFAQIPRPRSLRGDVAKDLERVTMKLLERDLPARYGTAEQAIAELLECADAPKTGRELLTATLGERFAGQAPVRHSQRRIHPIPPASRAPSGTLPDGSSSPPAAAAAMPSLGSLRNAPTGTLDHGASGRRQRKLVLAGAVLGLAALGSFAVVSAVSGRTASGGDPTPAHQIAAAVDASQSAAADAAVSPPPPPPPLSAPADAAAPIAPDLADAGIVRDALPARPAGPVKTGTLNVPGYPSLAVYWHGRKIGESPCRLPLPVGTHSITLMKQGSDVKYTDKTISVTIKADETTDVQR
jgi:eukaryotic-like serine/threonine-protein kinase